MKKPLTAAVVAAFLIAGCGADDRMEVSTDCGQWVSELDNYKNVLSNYEHYSETFWEDVQSGDVAPTREAFLYYLEAQEPMVTPEWVDDAEKKAADAGACELKPDYGRWGGDS